MQKSLSGAVLFDTLRNMHTFLMYSIKNDEDIELEDIYYFLNEMDKLMIMIEQKLINRENFFDVIQS